MSGTVDKNLIYTGDTTTHGGTLNDGWATSTRNGVHRCVTVGHKFWCPQCHCWSTFIEGAPNFTIYGKDRVLEGHRASCGATAIHRLGFYDTSVDSADSGRSGEIPRYQETKRAAQSRQGQGYAHHFRIEHQGDIAVRYIVFSAGTLLDLGNAVKKSWGGSASVKVSTDSGQKVWLAVQAPRPELK